MDDVAVLFEVYARYLLTIFQESDLLGERRKVWVLESLSGGQPLLGLEPEEGGEEGNAVGVEAGGLGHEGLGDVGGELVAGELLGPRDAWPVVLCRSSQHLQHSEALQLNFTAFKLDL